MSVAVSATRHRSASSHVPHYYRCACCNNLESDDAAVPCTSGADAYKLQLRSEQRRLLQLDVLEERAKPRAARSGSAKRRSFPSSRHAVLLSAAESDINRGSGEKSQRGIPNRGLSPPRTLSELRAQQQQQQQKALHSADRADANLHLILVVHSAKFLSSGLPRGSSVSLHVRYGVYEGTTTVGTVTSHDDDESGATALVVNWQEQFDLPIEDRDDGLWLHAVHQESGQIICAAEVRAAFLHDATGGIREAVMLQPVAAGDGTSSACARGSEEGRLALGDGNSGTALLSWQVVPCGKDGIVSIALRNDAADEAIDANADGTNTTGEKEKQVLRQDLMLAFSVKRFTSYAPATGDEESPDGRWYVAFRDAQGRMHDSVDLTRRSLYVFTPAAEGSCVAQVETSTRTVQVLVCRRPAPDGEGADDELIGATAVDVAKMPRQGSAALVVYAMNADGSSTTNAAGEVSVSWGIKPVTARRSSPREEDPCVPTPPPEGEHDGVATIASQHVVAPTDEASLIVKVLRGVDLRDAALKPLSSCRVLLVRGYEEGSTSCAVCPPESTMCNVRWSEDIVFSARPEEMTHQQGGEEEEEEGDVVDVNVIDADNNLISSGTMSVNQHEGMTAVEVFSGETSLGHILLRYVCVDAPKADKAVGTEEVQEESAGKDWTEVGAHPSPPKGEEEPLSAESPREVAAEDPLVDHSPTRRFSPRGSPKGSTTKRQQQSRDPSSPSAVTGAEETTNEKSAAKDADAAANEVEPDASRRIEDVFVADDDEEAAAGAARRVEAEQMSESSRNGDAEASLPPPSKPESRSVTPQGAADDDDDAHRQVSLQPARPPSFRAVSTAAGSSSRVVSIRFFPPTGPAPPEETINSDSTGVAERARPAENAPLSESSLYNGVASAWNDVPEIVMAADAQQREDESKHLLLEELDIDIRGGKRRQQNRRQPLPYPAPWYPPGQSSVESHIPLSRRESERRLLDEITVLQILAQRSTSTNGGGEQNGVSLSAQPSRLVSVTVPRIKRGPWRSTSRGVSPAAAAN